MRLTCLLQVFIAAAFFAATTAAWAGPQEDYRKGLNARAANDVVGAMASFTATLDSDPGHADAAFERGRLLLLIGEPLNAIADFTTAIIGNPGNGQAYALRGQAKATLGDRKAAAADFDKAIDVSPTDFEVYVRRATYRLKAGQIPAAIEDLKTAQKLSTPADAAEIGRTLDKLR
jgi:tetratricopeptide (TPR) repeat protein